MSVSAFAEQRVRADEIGAAGSTTHLVLIPSYNTGAKLFETVAAAQRAWAPIWVVIDGSTDGTGEALAEMAERVSTLRVLCRAENGGKGAAVLEGLRAAGAAGFTHVLVMDADGQHPASSIGRFMTLSLGRPEAMILGVPVFDETAPRIRVIGRKVSNVLTWLESFGEIRDSLFGFRVYPLAALRQAMEAERFMRRFDFDVEAAVRLCWSGISVINVPAPVRYFRAAEGGVSHFHYARDNLLLACMHARLLGGFLWRLACLTARRLRSFHH
ncbi:MAG TPA: glycosyltransferase family 2 protein [Stellaceae bacterium]